MTAAPRPAGPSLRAAPGAAATRRPGRRPAAPPAGAPRCGALASPRTASAAPRSHTSPGAAAPPAREAGHGSRQKTLANTRRKVVTTDTSGRSALGRTSAQAVAMNGAAPGTAGTGGEADPDLPRLSAPAA